MDGIINHDNNFFNFWSTNNGFQNYFSNEIIEIYFSVQILAFSLFLVRKNLLFLDLILIIV